MSQFLYRVVSIFLVASLAWNPLPAAYPNSSAQHPASTLYESDTNLCSAEALTPYGLLYQRSLDIHLASRIRRLLSPTALLVAAGIVSPWVVVARHDTISATMAIQLLLLESLLMLSAWTVARAFQLRISHLGPESVSPSQYLSEAFSEHSGVSPDEERPQNRWRVERDQKISEMLQQSREAAQTDPDPLVRTAAARVGSALAKLPEFAEGLIDGYIEQARKLGFDPGPTSLYLVGGRVIGKKIKPLSNHRPEDNTDLDFMFEPTHTPPPGLLRSLEQAVSQKSAGELCTTLGIPYLARFHSFGDHQPGEIQGAPHLLIAKRPIADVTAMVTEGRRKAVTVLKRRIRSDFSHTIALPPEPLSAHDPFPPHEIDLMSIVAHDVHDDDRKAALISAAQAAYQRFNQIRREFTLPSEKRYGTWLEPFKGLLKTEHFDRLVQPWVINTQFFDGVRLIRYELQLSPEEPITITFTTPAAAPVVEAFLRRPDVSALVQREHIIFEVDAVKLDMSGGVYQGTVMPVSPMADVGAAVYPSHCLVIGDDVMVHYKPGFGDRLLNVVTFDRAEIARRVHKQIEGVMAADRERAKNRTHNRSTQRREFTYAAGELALTVSNPNSNYAVTSAGAVSVGMSMLMRLLYPEAAEYPSVVIAPQKSWVGDDGSNLMQLYFSVAANFAFHKRKTKIVGTPEQLRRIQKYLELGNPYELPNLAGYPPELINRLRREAYYLADRSVIEGKPQMATPYHDMIEFIPIENGTAQVGDLTIATDKDGTYRLSDRVSGTTRAHVVESSHLTELDLTISGFNRFHRPEFGMTFLGTSSGMDPNGMSSNQIVWAGSQGVLIDIGSPTRAAMTALGLNPGDITEVVITHLHEDHIAGALAYFHWHREWQDAHGRQGAPLRLLMEPGLHAMFSELAAQVLGQPLEKVYPEVQLVSLPFYGSVTTDGLLIEAAPAWHGTPTSMLRFTYQGRTISHSSDTTFDPVRFGQILKDEMPVHIRQDLVRALGPTEGNAAVFDSNRAAELTHWLFQPNAQGHSPALVNYEAGNRADFDKNGSNHTTPYALHTLPKAYQEVITTHHTASLPPGEFVFALASPMSTVDVSGDNPQRSGVQGQFLKSLFLTVGAGLLGLAAGLKGISLRVAGFVRNVELPIYLYSVEAHAFATAA